MVRNTAAKLVPPTFRGATMKGSDKKTKQKEEGHSYEASAIAPPNQEPALGGALALGGGKGKDVISYRPNKGPKASGDGGLKMHIPAPKVSPASSSTSSTSLEVCGVAFVSYRPAKSEGEQKGGNHKGKGSADKDKDETGRKYKPPNYKNTRGDKRNKRCWQRRMTSSCPMR